MVKKRDFFTLSVTSQIIETTLLRFFHQFKLIQVCDSIGEDAANVAKEEVLKKNTRTSVFKVFATMGCYARLASQSLNQTCFTTLFPKNIPKGQKL